MTERPLVWIVGAGGLLGRATVAAAAVSHDVWTTPIPWTAPAVEDRLDRAVDEFRARSAGRPWSVAWCAGAGVIGTSADVLERETASLRRVLDGLRRHHPGSLFLASSAGGVHGGTADLPITEATVPAPLADYGRNKLVQEDIARAWAAATGGRVAIGRIANLYGPAQSLTKTQGLISQVCRSTYTRQPVGIYVPLDTTRDYLFAADAGRLVAAMLDRLEREPGASTTVKLVASGRSTSIAGILSEARRVLRRAAPVVVAASPTRRLQGSILSIDSRVWPDVHVAAATTLPAGIAAVAAGIREGLATGAIR